MNNSVIFDDGSLGTVIAGPAASDPEAMVKVQLEGGQVLSVPQALLLPFNEGSYRVADVLPSGFQSGQNQDSIEMTVIPLVEETLTVSKREIETGRVRLTTRVTERQVTVDEPLTKTQTEVRRVPVGQFVEAAPPVRHEDGVMIISVVEEVLVVEKRLRVIEEVHITQKQTEYHAPQVVTLRTEALTEERTTLTEEPQMLSAE